MIDRKPLRLVLAAAIGCMLWTAHADAQIQANAPSQLRPAGAATANNATAPAGGSHSPPLQATAGHLAAVSSGNLPTTDFGLQAVGTSRQEFVVLGDRAAPPTKGSGLPPPSNPLSGFSGLGKPSAEPAAPPSIRVTGSQAADFEVDAAQCQFVNQSYDKKAFTFRCPVVFRPGAAAPRTALIEAMFPGGDRLQAVLKGTGYAALQANQAPSAALGAGPLATANGQAAVAGSATAERLDFAYVPIGGKKTIRVATQFPAGSAVLPRLEGARISDGKGFGTEFTLGEAAAALGSAAANAKASFTITFAPRVSWEQHVGFLEFKDADGRLRKLTLLGSSAAK